MSTSEEEIYSLMFSSLRHPARRKILRTLSEEKVTFSQMLQELEIPSSHLTYHLENLGELVIKGDNGRYQLSSFGKAAVSMMKGAEEVPDNHAKRFAALPLRWKSLYAMFIIAIVLLSSMSYYQFTSYNKLSSNYVDLQNNYNIVKIQNDQLLLSNSSQNAANAKTLIQNVLQIDTSRYQMTLISDTVQVRTDLDGVVEEIMQYSLVNTASRFDLTVRFRNGHFSLFQINQLEGAPNFPLLYSQPQPTDVVKACQGVLQRYTSAFNDAYMSQILSVMTLSNNLTTVQTYENTKLSLMEYNGYGDVSLMYTNSGTDFQAKSINLVYSGYVLTEFSDDWALYKVGSTQINVSQSQAIEAAINAVKGFSWNTDGTQVSNFQVLKSPVSTELYPKPRADNLTLYPYWFVTLHLDKTYPGGVSEIGVGIWADTGEAINIQAIETT